MQFVVHLFSLCLSLCIDSLFLLQIIARLWSETDSRS